MKRKARWSVKQEETWSRKKKEKVKKLGEIKKLEKDKEIGKRKEETGKKASLEG